MVNEIDNPDLLPSIYPALYPYGVGGAPSRTPLPAMNRNAQDDSEDADDLAQRNALRRYGSCSLSAYFKCLLLRYKSSFAVSESFPFLALNMLQRKEVNIQSFLQLRSNNFEDFASEVNSLTLSDLNAIKEDLLSNPNCKITDKHLHALSQKLEIVGGRITGSPYESKKHRKNVKALCCAHGPPDLFVTVNPADIHHPLACHYAGIDFDLDEFVPDSLPSSAERARLMAKNPIAAARFFNVIIETMIQELILGKDKDIGGIFGPVKTYFGAN